MRLALAALVLIVLGAALVWTDPAAGLHLAGAVLMLVGGLALVAEGGRRLVAHDTPAEPAGSAAAPITG